MPPVIGTIDANVSADAPLWLVFVAYVGAVACSMLVWTLCACGGKKKEEPGAEPAAAAEETGETTKGKAEEKTAASAAQGAKQSIAKKTEAIPDKTLGPKGGPDVKRLAVPKGLAVAGDNPAYQTLMSDDQFKASQKPGAGGAKGPGLDKVAESSPAYQTILNDSKFEPSQKGKAAAKTGETVNAKASATAMLTARTATPTEATTQTGMQTARTVAPGGTTKM